MRILGVVGFAALVMVSVYLMAGERQAEPRAEAVRDVQPIQVVVSPARRAVFERSLTVQGNLQAKNVATISPRVAGTIETIMVDEGDVVEAGVTRLFQTDSVTLTKMVEVRTLELDVAEQSLREKQASLDKNRADFDKAEYDWQRYRELSEKGSCSRDEYEEAKAQYRRCTAMVRYAEALADLADAQLKQARSTLEIAKKELADSLVIAPISGRVTERYKEPGEMGDKDKPALRIEDPSLLEISAFLPARVYGEVVPDKTQMHVAANGVDLGEHAVVYRSPRIDATLRTFEARGLVRDPPEAVAPGAMAEVRVILERHEGIGVSQGAIQRRGDGRVVFVVDGDRARMVPVQVGLEMGDLIEVTIGEITEGMEIVTIGSYLLNPDAPIQIRQEGR